MNKWLTCFFCLSIIISCSTEEESEVPSLVGRGDGLYILCENNVSFFAPLNINSNDAISLNSGTISKVAGDRVLDEEGNPMQLNATASGTDTNGLIRLEGIMAADLTMTADADASFTVS